MKGDVAFSSGFTMILNAAIIVAGKDSLSIGAQTGIGVGITFIWAVTNALRIDQQGWLNNIAVILQISSAISIVVVLLVMVPQRATAQDVFTSTYNGTGFPFIYVCFIGILPALFSFSGYEGNIFESEHSVSSSSFVAGAHMAEETRGADRAVPKGIVWTCVCSAIVGTTYLLALLFVIPDVASFVNNNNSDNTTLNLVVATYQVAVPHQNALGLIILLLLNIYFAGLSSLTASSRIG
ncbi:unnamed protein product [Rotaria sp. Silwood2]|nr:unnamed protein product [Rotaria sp. Silwood2]CAF2968814.1 unnamed protein product [Rotaria sp. Silwood2]CAF3142248.1 unnamed protein product [Rotaria sp. Silwood2]CAF3879029.1 unnamed protein product [Rotaria sp. Silwood2]CAF4100431.1 unnamed protein product [Rotaria sp. Silwood2]